MQGHSKCSSESSLLGGLLLSCRHRLFTIITLHHYVAWFISLFSCTRNFICACLVMPFWSRSDPSWCVIRYRKCWKINLLLDSHDTVDARLTLYADYLHVCKEFFASFPNQEQLEILSAIMASPFTFRINLFSDRLNPFIGYRNKRFRFHIRIRVQSPHSLKRQNTLGGNCRDRGVANWWRISEGALKPGWDVGQDHNIWFLSYRATITVRSSAWRGTPTNEDGASRHVGAEQKLVKFHHSFQTTLTLGKYDYV